MASWVSINLSLSSSHPKTLIMAPDSKVAVWGIIPMSRSRRAVKVLSPTWSRRCTTSLYCCSGCKNKALCRHSVDPICTLSNVSYYNRNLTGYWVGPDVEDGWGFVEAFINEII